jgi:DNA (cytosine-5)-methyltransferase 1
VNRSKPPYRVPSMTEIEAIPWNGINVVSTFSGAGGSCLGYRMAGCRVLWANEFVPAAQEVYKLNHPSSVLNTADIRMLQASDVLAEIGLERGEIDILDGSPPCAAFSTAGKRARGWGEIKAYSDTEQRVDDLFFEYARILEGLQPRAFVAENVAGLVRGRAKGYFKLILRRLKECGYQVRASVLDASWLGVPQARKRLIFIGMRDDLGIRPEFPKPLPYQYTMKDALDSDVISFIMGDASHAQLPGNSFPRGVIHPLCEPSPTVTAGGYGTTYKLRKNAKERNIDPETGRGLNISDNGTQWTSGPSFHRRVSLAELRRICSFPADFKLGMTDVETGESLRLPPSREAAYENKEAFNMTIASMNKPAPTVTVASPGNDIGHPHERRRLTLGELRRISAFPDDFQLTGNYARRWERLGRAVPPVMMSKIAQAVCQQIAEGGPR